MDHTSSSQFLSSLSKFLQSLCNGYITFDDRLQVFGHLTLVVDDGQITDYVLNELLKKSDMNSIAFNSKSFHAQPVCINEPGSEDKNLEGIKSCSVPLTDCASATKNTSSSKTSLKRQKTQVVSQSHTNHTDELKKVCKKMKFDTDKNNDGDAISKSFTCKVDKKQNLIAKKIATEKLVKQKPKHCPGQNKKKDPSCYTVGKYVDQIDSSEEEQQTSPDVFIGADLFFDKSEGNELDDSLTVDGIQFVEFSKEGSRNSRNNDIDTSTRGNEANRYTDRDEAHQMDESKDSQTSYRNRPKAGPDCQENASLLQQIPYLNSPSKWKVVAKRDNEVVIVKRQFGIEKFKFIKLDKPDQQSVPAQKEDLAGKQKIRKYNNEKLEQKLVQKHERKHLQTHNKNQEQKHIKQESQETSPCKKYNNKQINNEKQEQKHLKQEIKKTSPIKKIKYKCSYCFRKFHNQSGQVIHEIYCVKQPKKHHFKCTFCSRKFLKEIGLQTHAIYCLKQPDMMN